MENKPLQLDVVEPTLRESKVKKHYNEQMKLYSPCSCGSGKKFKFCCKGKDTFVLNTDAG